MSPTWVFIVIDPRPTRKDQRGRVERSLALTLLYDVRQQAEEACTLDRLREFALFLL